MSKQTDYLIPTYNRYPVTLVSGDGVYVFDKDNKKYLDFIGGIAVNAFGYNDKTLKEVITNQVGKLMHVSNMFYTEELLKAAEILAKATGMDEVFFTNSGAESIEGAIKLARRYQNQNKNGAYEIIAMDGSFHGRTVAAVSITGTPAYHENFGPMLEGVKFAKFNDIDSIKKLITPNIAAIILEPLKGEGGIIPADESFLKELRDLCDKENILLIFDEVQCGASRTGSFLYSQQLGVKPDILAVAKGIGAGFPVGAFLATKGVGDALSAGTHGSTYGGNSLATAIVASTVKRLTEPEFLEEIKDKGKYFKDELIKLQNKFPKEIKDVRGEGLILGIELNDSPASIIEKAREKGLLLVSAAGNVIRFVPPLIISKEEIKEGINILEEVFKEI